LGADNGLDYSADTKAFDSERNLSTAEMTVLLGAAVRAYAKPSLPQTVASPTPGPPKREAAKPTE
jgi:hypothetical protein